MSEMINVGGILFRGRLQWSVIPERYRSGGGRARCAFAGRLSATVRNEDGRVWIVRSVSVELLPQASQYIQYHHFVHANFITCNQVQVNVISPRTDLD